MKRVENEWNLYYRFHKIFMPSNVKKDRKNIYDEKYLCKKKVETAA
jgi:hypothetical protein